MTATSNGFDNGKWSDIVVGTYPINRTYHVKISTDGEYSLVPDYCKEMINAISAALFEWQLDLTQMEKDLNEYLAWLYYTRIQEVTREGEKVIDAKSNQIVVPVFISSVLERIGLAYSPCGSTLIIPQYDGDPFEQFQKTSVEAKAFIISFASKLRTVMEKAGLKWTTSISKEQTGDYETMILEVMKSEQQLERFQLAGQADSSTTTEKHSVPWTATSTRAVGELNQHPITGFFASMLGVRQIERALVPTVFYDTFDIMKQQLMKAVVCGSSDKPRTVPRHSTCGS